MSASTSVGLISGIDFNAMIAKIMEVEKRPITNMNATTQKYQSQQSALAQIKGKLEEVKTKAAELYKETNFISRTATATDAEVLTVSADATSGTGTYSIKVNQLAQSDRRAAQGFADVSATPVAAGDGIFMFQVGTNGTIYTVNVNSTTTLNDLRDLINGEESGMKASIINDGSDHNPYRLVITSSETGASNYINILTNNTTLDFSQTNIEDAQAKAGNTFDGTVASNTGAGNYTGTTSKRYVVEITTAGAVGAAKYRVSEDGGLTWGANDAYTTDTLPTSIFKTTDQGVDISFTAGAANFAVGDTFTIDAFAPELQTAQDSYLEIDGLQVNRSTNSISDAIEGVTLDLLKTETTNPVSVKIGNNDSNVKGLILQFVQSYNSAIGMITEVTKYDAKTGEKGVLLGDSTARSAKNALQRIVSSAVLGLSSEGINSLAQIGITTNKVDGSLKTDSTLLDKAIKDNYEDVKKIFALVGSTSTSNIEFVDSTGTSLYGKYEVWISQAATQATVIGNQGINSAGITNAESLNFDINDRQVSVSLEAGDKLADIVEKINNTMDSNKIDIRASIGTGNTLQLKTVNYGSETHFTVISDQNGGVDTQTGIGTTLREDTGKDVAGSINGQAADGSGQQLVGADSSSVKGIKLNITATTTGFVGILSLTQGIADQLYRLTETYINSTDGFIKARTDGLTDSIKKMQERIEDYNDKITVREAQLQTKFQKLEGILAQYQYQSQTINATLGLLSVK